MGVGARYVKKDGIAMQKGEKTLCDCGHYAECDGFGTGYGINRAGRLSCYACCGIEDRKSLIETGKQIGYLSYDQEPKLYRRTGLDFLKNGKYGNWPGTFTIPISSVRRSFNNFGAVRLDFWFTLEGARYWGVNIGDNQLARVKRIKG
jgi:hypothetical protein